MAKLRAIFIKNGIKYKTIRVTKMIEPAKMEEYRVDLATMIERLADMKTQGYEILYLDEVMFTSRAYAQRAWSRRNEHF